MIVYSQVNSLNNLLSEKEKKVCSLLENMQDMENQLLQLEQQQTIDAGTGDHSNVAELELLKSTLAEKEKALSDKELMCRKAIATAKKLKLQLNQANKSLEESKLQLAELTSHKSSSESETRQAVQEEVMVADVNQLQEQSSCATAGVAGGADTEDGDHNVSVISTTSLPEDTILELESLRSQLTTYR